MSSDLIKKLDEVDKALIELTVDPSPMTWRQCQTIYCDRCKRVLAVAMGCNFMLVPDGQVFFCVECAEENYDYEGQN